MSTSSNDTGRAFEYAIATNLMEFFDSEELTYSLTERAIQDNERDKSYFDSLSPEERSNFILASKKFIEWIKLEGWISDAQEVVLDRLPDREGRIGNVTDIELKIKKDDKVEEKNISIKHNHNALKHPRLPRLPTQSGIKDLKIDKEWREKHQKIWEEFIRESKKLDANAKLFRELISKDPDYINQNLYKPLIESVIAFLEKYVNNPENSKKFFSFLTNQFDFYTVKDESNKVLIKKFLGIESPSSFEIEYPYLNRLNTMKMSFDNGWELTLRLHTASSRMYHDDGRINTSTKFDVLCLNLNDLIEIIELPKP